MTKQTTLLFIVLILFSYMKATAVPALPVFFEIEQPDGQIFNARKVGDEWFHWQETRDRKIVILNRKTGFHEYAVVSSQTQDKRLVPSGVIVNSSNISRSLSDLGLQPVTRRDLRQIRTRMLRERKRDLGDE